MTSKLLTALEKIQAAQHTGMQRMGQKQEESLTKQLINALVHKIEMAKGDKGDKPIAGIDFPIPRDGKDGYTPRKGVDYVDGKDGKTPIAGVDFPLPKDGKNGRDGADGTANMAEVEGAIDECMSEHKKECNHALIHDPKMLGEYELDTTSLQEGDYLQVKGKKLVGVKIQKQDLNGLRSWVTSQGVSSVRSYSITASTTLDAMAIYVVDATSGDITITLPSAAGRENYWFELIRIDATANTVTIVPTGSETMSGMTDYQMQQWTTVKLFAYNLNYLLRSA